MFEKALNEPVPKDPVELEKSKVPRADLYASRLSGDPERPFVGISISGGGSRAANFGWAVLERLNELGILEHVDSISSVSGGSLPAALYAVQADQMKTARDWRKGGDLLAADFLTDWGAGLFSPPNWALMWASRMDRTSLMAAVFDKNIFHGATFGTLGPYAQGRPQLFLNTTSVTAPEVPVIFNDDFFRTQLESRLDSYPLATAVMASGAFPGVFGSMPLNVFGDAVYDYTKGEWVPTPSFVRIYDGGPADNLGIWTLVERARALYKENAAQGKGLRGCLLISIDASAPDFDAGLNSYLGNADTTIADYIIKPTAWQSINALLAQNRLKTLRAIGHLPGLEDPLGPEHKYFSKALAQRYDAKSFAELQWQEIYHPVSSFPLFGPAVPWGIASSWAQADGSVDLDLPQSTEQLRATVTSRAEKTKQLEAGAPACVSWHITFGRLLSLANFTTDEGVRYKAKKSTALEVYDFEKPNMLLMKAPAELDPAIVSDAVLNYTIRYSLYAYMGYLKTSYNLSGPKGCSKESILDAINSTADLLVKEDDDALEAVCSWFGSMHIDAGCLKAPLGPSKPHLLGANPKGFSVWKSAKRSDVPLFECGG